MGQLKRIPHRIRLGAGIVCGAITVVAIIVVGCVAASDADRPNGSGGGSAETGARGDNGDGSYRAPRISPGAAIVVAHDGPYSAYNNKTAQTNNDPDNILVLNQVLVDPFIVDGNGKFLVNSDVLVSAELTSEDPQVVTYRIKPDVKWSDGQPWDCDDFYLAWLAGSGKSPYFAPATTRGYERATAECRDQNTFIETYQSPYADWQRNYIHNAILPAHILERETGISDITALSATSALADLKKAGDFWNSGWTGFNAATMPGSGPYQIDSSAPGEPTILIRNKAWVGNPAGPERIVLASVADGVAAVRGMQDQQFQVVQLPADPLLADRLRALSTQGVIFEARGGPTAEHLDFNLASPLFTDPVVRTAFAQCVDRNKLVDELIRGVLPETQPLGSLVFLPSDAPYDDIYSEKMVADAQQAQVTLERAGWILGQDGVYSRGRQRLSFSISHDATPRHSRLVELIRMQCRQAGMEIADAPGDLGQALARGSFDVALTTSARIPRAWSLADHFATAGRFNYQNYTNPEVDTALGVAETQYAESIQVDALRKADRLLADDLVSLPLFQLPVMWAYTNDVDGVYRHGFSGVTWNANEWKVN
jgi:peptide/nickel transport system substrate-binding protein